MQISLWCIRDTQVFFFFRPPLVTEVENKKIIVASVENNLRTVPCLRGIQMTDETAIRAMGHNQVEYTVCVKYF